MYEKIFQLQEEVFKVLANQKRLEIIQLLSNNKLCVTEMINMLGLSQSNLSQHLSLMRRAGLLKVTKNGTKVYYQLTDSKLAELVFSVRDFLIDHERLDDETKQYFTKPQQLYPLAKDAVCGMRLSAARASYHTEYNEQEYFFCASGCHDLFVDNPQKYAMQNSKHKEMFSEQQN